MNLRRNRPPALRPAASVPQIPEFADIKAAAVRIAPHLNRTPVWRSLPLDALTGAQLFFKREDLQEPGSFKARGAASAVFSLGPGCEKSGVITHSSGNHGAALAFAARLRSIPATVIMPEGAMAAKRRAVRRYGGRIEDCANSAAARAEKLRRLQRASGAEFIHPYNDPRVIAGQGTCAVELLEQAAGLDAIVAPVGGGGLLSGTCLTAAAAKPPVPVFGAEPEQADDACRSLSAGRIVADDAPDTIADGLRTPLLNLTWQVVSRRTSAILTVSEKEIVAAMEMFARASGVLIEPSSAVALAAVHRHREKFSGMRVGVIVTGGNVELAGLPDWAAEKLRRIPLPRVEN